MYHTSDAARRLHHVELGQEEDVSAAYEPPYIYWAPPFCMSHECGPVALLLDYRGGRDSRFWHGMVDREEKEDLWRKT